MMAELFQTTVPNISMHIRNIYAEGELRPEATVKKILTVRQEGARKVQGRNRGPIISPPWSPMWPRGFCHTMGWDPASNAPWQIGPRLIFADDRDGTLFTATVYRKPVSELTLTDKGALKVQIKGQHAPINAPITDFQMHLMNIIRANPVVSYDELAKLTDKDRTTVMRNIGKLKNAGILKRVGSRKAGHWEVLE